MAEISQWSKTASNNVTVSPDGANLGWTGSQVGPWARETMAQVASWYQDPLFTSFLKDLNPENTVKTVLVTAADTITISNFDSSPVAHFPVGRFMQIVTDGGDIHPGFVASGPDFNVGTNVLTVVFDFITAGLTIDPSADNVSQEGVQFAITSESASSGNYSKSTLALGGQLVGAAILGGGGTTAERDAKFPVAPSVDGILWSNSTTRYLEVSVAGLGVVEGDITLDSASVTVVSTAGMRVGQPISTASTAVIPADTTIQEVTSPTEFQLSQVAAAADASADMTVASAWVPASERMASTAWASGSGDQGRAYIDDRDGKFYHGFQTSATSTLDVAMDATETIVPLVTSGATGFPPSGSVLLESEEIFYPVISGDNLGTSASPCTRGYNGTTAATHVITTAVDAQNATRSLTPGAGFGLDADLLRGVVPVTFPTSGSGISGTGNFIFSDGGGRRMQIVYGCADGFTMTVPSASGNTYGTGYARWTFPTPFLTTPTLIRSGLMPSFPYATDFDPQWQTNAYPTNGQVGTTIGSYRVNHYLQNYQLTYYWKIYGYGFPPFGPTAVTLAPGVGDNVRVILIGECER